MQRVGPEMRVAGVGCSLLLSSLDLCVVYIVKSRNENTKEHFTPVDTPERCPPQNSFLPGSHVTGIPNYYLTCFENLIYTRNISEMKILSRGIKISQLVNVQNMLQTPPGTHIYPGITPMNRIRHPSPG